MLLVFYGDIVPAGLPVRCSASGIEGRLFGAAVRRAVYEYFCGVRVPMSLLTPL